MFQDTQKLFHSSSAPLGLDAKDTVCLSHAAMLLTMLREKSLGDLTHSICTAWIAETIACGLALMSSDVMALFLAGLLHDVGKIYIDQSILHAPRPLSPKEKQIVRQHPLKGAELVDMFISPQISIFVKHHHELPDGSGYPDKLKNGDIPLQAKLIAVSDKFTALTMDRKYRDAFTQVDAVTEIDSCITGFFDGDGPVIRDTLLEIDIDHLRRESLAVSKDIIKLLTSFRFFQNATNFSAQ